MNERQDILAFIINSDSFERIAFALDVATTAAATGKDVRLIFGNKGIVRLKKGYTDQLGTETDSWIKNRLRLGMKKGGIASLSELLRTLKKLGGKIYACPAAMDLYGITVAQLIEEVDEVRSLVRFVTEDMADASVIYV